jgi:hypothetical protein
MRIIISENKLNRTIIKWLSGKYGDLEIYDHDNQPWVLYANKNSELIFLYNTKDNMLYFAKDFIKFFWDIFSINVEQTKNILIEWFETHTGLKSNDALGWDFSDASDWKKVVRWETKKRLS